MTKELEEQKEFYNSGAYVYYLFNNHSNKWLKPYWCDFHTNTIYKLIHKKHEHIADAVIANPDVEVEWLIEPNGVTKPEDMFNPRWERRVRFFDTYAHDLKYRLIEPKQASKSDVKPTRVEVIGSEGREFSKLLTDSKYEIHIQDEGRTIKLFETPIRKEWYEYEENFPAIVYDSEDTVAIAIYLLENKLYSSYGEIIDIASGCRLATKAEVNSLYCEEE